MTDYMPLGEMVQELTYLRARYEQFIIDRERERILKTLENRVPKCNEQQYDFLGCDCSISYHDLYAVVSGQNND